MANQGANWLIICDTYSVSFVSTRNDFPGTLVNTWYISTEHSVERKYSMFAEDGYSRYIRYTAEYTIWLVPVEISRRYSLSGR